MSKPDANAPPNLANIYIRGRNAGWIGMTEASSCGRYYRWFQNSDLTKRPVWHQFPGDPLDELVRTGHWQRHFNPELIVEEGL